MKSPHEMCSVELFQQFVKVISENAKLIQDYQSACIIPFCHFVAKLWALPRDQHITMSSNCPAVTTTGDRTLSRTAVSS